MQLYNYSKLSGRMRECGYTQEKLAKAVGISATSMNLTLNNKRNFRQDEILKVGKILDIPTAELESYFFAQNL